MSICRRCAEAGFPNEKISFINSGKKRPDGKVFWDLLNEDYSLHIHKSPTEKFPQIENDKPPARPTMSMSVESEKLELTQEEISKLKKFLAMLDLVVVSK